MTAADNPVVRVLLQLWNEGRRDNALYWEVRDAFPELTLDEFNKAALETWKLIWARRGATP